MYKIVPILSDVININWMLTFFCNYDCNYCSSHDNTWKNYSFEEMKLAFNRLNNVLTQIGKDKTPNIWFTGGEPTQIEWFEEFLVHIKKSNPNIELNLTTNGSKPYKYYYNLHDNYMNNITYSLHFDWVNYKNFITKIYKLAEFFKNKVSVSIMYEKRHSTLAEKTMKFCQDTQINARIITVRTSGREKSFYYNHSNSEVNFIKENNNNLNDILVDDKEYSSDKLLSDMVIDNLDFNNWKCWAGTDCLYVDKNLNLKSSFCGIKNYGNLLTENPDYGWDNNPVICDGRFCGCVTDVRARKEKI